MNTTVGSSRLSRNSALDKSQHSNDVVGNSQLIQRMNRLKVLNYIRRNPMVARPFIASVTGLSLASLTNITSYLLEKKLLVESGAEKTDRVGRKGTMLKFNATAYGFIFVFLDINKLNIFYTDLEGEIITRLSAIVDNTDMPAVIEIIKKNIASLVSEYGTEKILSIGIAVSGMVLDDSNFILSSSLRLKDFDLKTVLEKETGLPVFVENISLFRAIWYFRNQEYAKNDNMVFVDLNNGIGSSQYYKGKVNRAMLGEIGHTTVEKDGEQCFCGNRGCLEVMCSAQRIIKLYNMYSRETTASLSYVASRYYDGNASAVNAVNECAGYLGIGLANLVNICNPKMLIIDIGSFAELRSVVDIAVSEMQQRAFPSLMQNLMIREISSCEKNTLSGAAFNLCDRIFDIAYKGNIIA